MRFPQQHLSGTKIALDLGKRDCVPLFHPQIIKISAKLLALIKHRMFTFGCLPGKWPSLYLWWSHGKSCGFPTFTFQRLWYSPSSTIALSSNPLVLRQLYKATCGRQKTAVQLSPLHYGQNNIESSQRVDKPHGLRLLKWSSASQTTWNQQASCYTGYL